MNKQWYHCRGWHDFGNVWSRNDYPTLRVLGNVTESPEICQTKKSFPVSLHSPIFNSSCQCDISTERYDKFIDLLSMIYRFQFEMIISQEFDYNAIILFEIWSIFFFFFFFFKCCYPYLVDLLFIVVQISFFICNGLCTTDDL